MTKFSASITINSPIEDVFAFVTDVDNDAKWQSAVIEAKATSEKKNGLGATYSYIVEVFGKKLETNGEVTAYEPHSRYEWKSTNGPFPISGGSTFEATADGVRVTQTINAEPGGFFKLAEPLMNKQQKSQMEKDLAQLKSVLEG